MHHRPRQLAGGLIAISFSEERPHFLHDQHYNSFTTLTTLIYITTQPSILFPVEQLTALAKQAHPDVTVMIDGAHAPGMVGIDVAAIGADVYTGNFHKWLFAPKGTAFMWVRESCRTAEFPHPSVISSRGCTDYQGE